MKKTPANPFQPGNTFGRGRPHGSRNKATLVLQEMLDDHGESITRKCALLAMQGDPTALRLCMERLIPPKKDHAVIFKGLPTTSAREVAAAMDAVLRDMAVGQITPAESQMIMASLEGRHRIIRSVDHEARMDKLEAGSDAAAEPEGRFISFPEDNEEDSDESKSEETEKP
jgi:hypothetical protein